MIVAPWHMVFRIQIVLLFLGSLPLAHSQNPAASYQPVRASAFVYSTTRVQDARHLAHRVGWSERNLDAQMQGVMEPNQRLWSTAVKAALLGIPEQVEQVCDQLVSTQTPEFSNRQHDLHQIGFWLQTYDCLTALPEWETLTNEKRTKVEEQCTTRIKEFFGHPPVGTSPAELLHWQATRLYAGLLAHATPMIQASLDGDERTPSLLAQCARQAMPGEGLLAGGHTSGSYRNRSRLAACWNRATVVLQNFI